MELTPQLLETQQFPEKWRGYDQDAVDEFLERVGVGLGQLQDRLRTTVSKLKELEAGAGQPVASSTVTQSETPPPPPRQLRDSEFNKSHDSGSGADVTAVARALVIAQEASEAALLEARSEGARITAEAKAEAAVMLREAEVEANRLTSEAERRHEAATSRLDEADALAAEKAEEALHNARGEAQRLVADAGKAAATLTSDARAEADRVTRSATEVAEKQAGELAAKRGGELSDLDDEISSRRREAAALQDEISNRQVELLSVVEGLQSLIGRVGSLTTGPPAEQGSVDEVVAAEIEVPTEPDVARVTAAPEEPEPAHEPNLDKEPDTTPLREPGAGSAVIDLTSDDAVDAGDSVDEAESEVPSDDAPVQRSPRWANVDSSPKQPLVDRRGLSVVGADGDVDDSAVSTVIAEQSPGRRPEVSGEKLTSKRATSDRSAAADDPFLAALRGPDRAEFDDDGALDADQSSFKRRRRRRL